MIIIANRRVLFQKLGEEAVLLHLDSEEYFGLDPVGTRIWEVLCEHQSIDLTVNILVEEYQVDKANLKIDIEELVNKLLEKELIEHV